MGPGYYFGKLTDPLEELAPVVEGVVVSSSMGATGAEPFAGTPVAGSSAGGAPFAGATAAGPPFA